MKDSLCEGIQVLLRDVKESEPWNSETVDSLVDPMSKFMVNNGIDNFQSIVMSLALVYYQRMRWTLTVKSTHMNPCNFSRPSLDEFIQHAISLLNYEAGGHGDTVYLWFPGEPRALSCDTISRFIEKWTTDFTFHPKVVTVKL
jgi:hypothetical protein